MVKGAIFLSKSAAVKAAILKYGSYMVVTKGIAATVSAGMTVATAAGSLSYEPSVLLHGVVTLYAPTTLEVFQ